MKKIILTAVIFFLLGVTAGYAMAPMLLCYMSSAGVCVNVTTSTPLPAQSD